MINTFNPTGLITCSYYAFPPNFLHYCGPEKQNDLIGYQHEQIVDKGLVEIIRDFQTLYPYLKLIAHENDIADPFDPRVVEAYWIGNNLLNNVSMKNFNLHLTETMGLKKRIKRKDLDWLIGKIPQGAIPHHTFHVLNVFTRTGHHAVEHTLETMDACRISWGRVKSYDLPAGKAGLRVASPKSIQVETQPLVLEDGKLTLGKPIVKEINVPSFTILNTEYCIPNTWVSFHWNTFCDVLTIQQVHQLEHFTQQAVQLANTTL